MSGSDTDEYLPTLPVKGSATSELLLYFSRKDKLYDPKCA